MTSRMSMEQGRRAQGGMGLHDCRAPTGAQAEVLLIARLRQVGRWWHASTFELAPGSALQAAPVGHESFTGSVASGQLGIDGSPNPKSSWRTRRHVSRS